MRSGRIVVDRVDRSPGGDREKNELNRTAARCLENGATAGD
jgi:hypothetical protein